MLQLPNSMPSMYRHIDHESCGTEVRIQAKNIKCSLHTYQVLVTDLTGLVTTATEYVHHSIDY
ncbi:Ovule protein [Caenorhabditis elegans]|uniref:Ovule protein n=1 Tax=Caenorhabditis elegans TaxID=6239 RepID=G3MU55_CAEEL|nr:Ovule protein [Caenorhabditis elegans]CCD31078.1 Ovule protein [Caenorhabditis elegans]|eukprot:NP_001256680.1 Uncharacterized protein CELE_F53E4.2 [Caenorhabditis elegans]